LVILHIVVHYRDVELTQNVTSSSNIFFVYERTLEVYAPTINSANAHNAGMTITGRLHFAYLNYILLIRQKAGTNEGNHRLVPHGRCKKRKTSMMKSSPKMSAFAIGLIGGIVLLSVAPAFAQEPEGNGSDTPHSRYERSYRQTEHRNARQAYGQAARTEMRGAGPGGQCWINGSPSGSMGGHWGNCSEPGATPDH
jgi:hypothetical protein